ncbi:hypothetical protein AB447_200565 [Bacillus glycinifermentans]|uniref:Uncharacterized protein n=1 Tax=Bacillus glycinifermentans TaxID=1664069 RepID=A0A0T6BVG7_9BACI|nr:hypothetical protein AB447_200565 [Bacillus glycinifermentans]
MKPGQRPKAEGTVFSLFFFTIFEKSENKDIDNLFICLTIKQKDILEGGHHLILNEMTALSVSFK